MERVGANRSRSRWSPSIGPSQGFDRPSLAPGYTTDSAVRGAPEQWFDPAAFVLQPAGTYGIRQTVTSARQIQIGLRVQF